MDFTSLGLLILRIGLAGTMAVRHGLPKLLDFANSMHSFPDPIGLGSEVGLALVVFAEFLCSLLIVVGVFTRFAAIPVVVAMAVAFFVVHGADPFTKKEMAFIYLTGFACILATGAGKFSADALFRGKK